VEFRKGLDVFDATKDGRDNASGYAPRGSRASQGVRRPRPVDASFGLGPIFELAGLVRGQWTKTRC
jgi:hypothetical protein